MTWDLKTLIIAPLITVIFIYIAKWIENRIRNREPLQIKVDIKHFDINYQYKFMSQYHPLGIFIPICFTNNTFLGFDVFFSDFHFQPKKKIKELRFQPHNKIYGKKDTGIHEEKLIIKERTNKTGYLYIDIKSSKDYEKEDFLTFLESIKNNPIILKFNYVVSNDPKDKEFETEIKYFFKELINKIEVLW